MASDESDVEWQTGEIVKCLLENADEAERKSLELDVNMSPDKPTGDDFDPAVICDKLRTCADLLNDGVGLQAALADLKKASAVTLEDAKTAFCRAVEALPQSQATQSAEMSSEMKLINATVGFGLYVVKSSPDLKNTVQSAMVSFLNMNLCKWVAKQGGWNKLNI
ncbi:uncharacterized protein AB9X84_010197 [Acanthopagrus schlegelii]